MTWMMLRSSLRFLGPLAHVLVDETRVSMRPGACGMTWPLFQLPL